MVEEGDAQLPGGPKRMEPGLAVLLSMRQLWRRRKWFVDFFNDMDLVERGGSDSQIKKQIVTEWLQELGWTIVTNQTNKRFICPHCQEPAMPM